MLSNNSTSDDQQEEKFDYFRACIRERPIIDSAIKKIISIDELNHHVYMMLDTGSFIVYDYRSEKKIKEFKVDVDFSKSNTEFCKYITQVGDLYFCVHSHYSDLPKFCKYNTNTDELKIIEKDHEILKHFYMNMLNTNEKVYFYGNRFKSQTSHLVEYNSKNDTLEAIKTFTDDGGNSFNYEYPDAYFMKLWNEKVIAIGTTSFSCQAFSDGVLDRDVWVFSKDGSRRIKTSNCSCYHIDLPPYATCYIPYGKDIAGIMFGGWDEDNQVKIDKLLMLVLPLDELENIEELEWKTFDLPTEVSAQLNGSSSCHLIDYISEKYYKFLIVQTGRMFEFEFYLDNIYLSAQNISIHRNVKSFNDIDFKFD